jgi:isopentenyl-diphosphate delta-isomerase
MEMVILVDVNDNAIGTMEKLEAHERGELHRAFSILLYNTQGEMLLQKRARSKYHSGGLWTNACCSHPIPGERIEETTRRRLQEEMGIDVPLSYSHKFIYKTSLDRNLTEHELDHVFIGQFNGTPLINKNEVEDWKYASVDWLKDDVIKNPDNYTYWFKLLISQSQSSTAK